MKYTDSEHKEVFRGKHFSVFQYNHHIPGAGNRVFEYAYRVDGTRIIAEDNIGRILLTHEYREEQKKTDLRLPGGKLNYPTEDIIEAAARELKEETGILADKMELLWSTTPDATIRFRRHFILAKNLIVTDQQLDEGEQITTEWFHPSEALKRALSGEISEEISALAIIRYITGKA